MKMTRLVRLSMILMLTAATLPAQSGEDAVFAPFVSRLRLAINDPQVRITWEPAPGEVTGYFIYRSDSEITTATLDEAELVARVDPATDGYVDIPLELGTYHYAVLVEAQDGAPVRFVIPGRNASFRPIEITQIATDLERSAGIESLEAVVTDARTVELRLNADRGGRTLALYRSTRPIQTPEDLLDATLFREITSETRTVEDFPVPGVAYYYAAADTAQILAKAVELAVGRNATEQPVSLPLERPTGQGQQAVSTERVEPGAGANPGEPVGAAGSEPLFQPIRSVVRAFPLPFLQLQTRLASDERLDQPRTGVGERRPASGRSEAAIASIVSRATVSAAMPTGPPILGVDTVGQATGAEYTLQTILTGPFERMAWEEALQQINNFFSLPLTADLRARAHYYRAQLYYHLGEERNALLEFLLARDLYYVESEAWIRHILGDGTQ